MKGFYKLLHVNTMEIMFQSKPDFACIKKLEDMIFSVQTFIAGNSDFIERESRIW